MNRDLSRRLIRIEQAYASDGSRRFDVSSVPADAFGNPTGPEHDREMTAEEWARRHCDPRDADPANHH